MKRQKKSRLSSGDGWQFNPDRSTPTPTANSGKPVVKLRMERRRGKATTILYDMSGIREPKVLAKHLKNMVSAGGTVKDQQIEIQGEHRDRIREYLQEQGYTVKG